MSRSAQNRNCWSRWHERLHKKLQNNQELLPTSATLLLAISGGQDSMTLLKLVTDLQRIYQWNIHIWHGDHGWHHQSKQIAEELQAWCIEQKLDCYVSKGSKGETNSEEKARNWRYTRLEKRAQSISSKLAIKPCTRVLTGHTASDRAETLIMNLARGSDLTGLSALSESRSLTRQIKLIRPLLTFSREETSQICKEFELPVWLDPSNNNTDITRNKIRKNVIPILKEIHRGSDIRISSLAAKLENFKEDQNALAKIALEMVQGKNKNSLSIAKLKDVPFSTRRILLATWLKQIGISNLNSKLVEEINYKLNKTNYNSSIDLAKGWKIQWRDKEIQLTRTISLN